MSTKTNRVSQSANAPKQGDFVGVTEAARMLNLTPGRVRQLVGNHESGALPAVKLGPRAWMISIANLKKFAKQNEIELKIESPKK